MTGLEEINYLYENMTTCETTRLKHHLEVIEKELKALEIIKEKISKRTLLHLFAVELNKDDFDFMKEVLKDE